MRRPSDLRRERHQGKRSGRRDVKRSSPLTWPHHFASSHEDLQALLVLLSLPSLTARHLLEMADRLRTASACLSAIRDRREGSEGDGKRARELDPDQVAAHLDVIGGRLVPVHHSEYPECLLDLYDPPAGLFVRGRRLDAEAVTVAVVGARRCSPAGTEMSTAIGRALGETGACVVSGGARGIDAAAHRGVLAANGKTVCVLGSGLDVVYPPRHKNLLSEIAERGTLVTEYGPGIPAEPFRFPARNRLVAALARATVVVEGAPGSGSMITVNHALELGREVLAVPGSVSAALAAVPLELIREGATPIRGPDDLLEDLGLASAASMLELNPDAASDEVTSRFSDAERRVWQALTSTSAPDQLALATGMPLSQVVAALTTLELNGMVLALGGRYERKRPSPPP
ncbi:MAG TPA: DNA-processing protein DprA [Actinomycetota bacterium]|nr:DNA-processing protein DprA [Actinomycetota bacterium]